MPVSPSIDPCSAQLLAALENCELGAGELHHLQHVRAAWACLRTSGALPTALERFSTALQRFAEHHGAHDLYHETITWCYLLLIHERMLELGPDHSWEDFEAAASDLLERGSGLLHRHYSSDRLDSDLAKVTFLLPDRAARAATPMTLQGAEHV